MNVFISGPMTNLPEFNFPAFNRAAARFREAGHIVKNPTELVLVKYGPDHVLGSAPHGDYLRLCLTTMIHDCDSIALLPRWRRSGGAVCEVAVALSLHFTFFDALSPGRALKAPQVFFRSLRHLTTREE